MAHRAQSDLAKKILGYIANDAKESARLEYKLEVDVSSPERKAEFVRDILSLANSEGEVPRRIGYLVLGYRNGQRFSVRGKGYEASHFGKVIDAFISPSLSYAYNEFSNGERGLVGVLSIRSKTTVVYVVKKDLLSKDRRELLRAGQAWGRRADRKEPLTGEDIQSRWAEIVERRIALKCGPLERRIEKLEGEGGPAFEVKRIRYELELTRDWSTIQEILERLVSYARDYDDLVLSEVMDAIYEVTARTHTGMTYAVASVIGGLLDIMMPLAGGGLNRRATRRLKIREREQLRRMGDRVFEMTWDSCRYLRALAVTQVCANQFWQLIRFAKLNGLDWELKKFVHDARRCQEKCLEIGTKPLLQQIEFPLPLLLRKRRVGLG